MRDGGGGGGREREGGGGKEGTPITKQYSLNMYIHVHVHAAHVHIYQVRRDVIRDDHCLHSVRIHILPSKNLHFFLTMNHSQPLLPSLIPFPVVLSISSTPSTFSSLHVRL